MWCASAWRTFRRRSPRDQRALCAGFNRATYAQLTAEALIALRREAGVIVDATCRSREDRAQLLDGLAAAGVPLLVVRCEAPLELVLSVQLSGCTTVDTCRTRRRKSPGSSFAPSRKLDEVRRTRS